VEQIRSLYEAGKRARAASAVALEQREARFAWLRLAVFAAGAILVFAVFRWEVRALWLFAPAVLFAALVVAHARTIQTRERMERVRATHIQAPLIAGAFAVMECAVQARYPPDVADRRARAAARTPAERAVEAPVTALEQPCRTFRPVGQPVAAADPSPKRHKVAAARPQDVSLEDAIHPVAKDDERP